MVFGRAFVLCTAALATLEETLTMTEMKTQHTPEHEPGCEQEGICDDCRRAEIATAGKEETKATLELWDRLSEGGFDVELLWENLEDNYEPGIDCAEWLRAALEDSCGDAVSALRGVCARCGVDHAELSLVVALGALEKEAAKG